MQLTADTITDDQIKALRAELAQRKHQNAYTRSIRKDCDAALNGDRACRESAATAYEKLRAENKGTTIPLKRAPREPSASFRDPPKAPTREELDAARKTRAINEWIGKVLRAAGIPTILMRDGSWGLAGCPAKYVTAISGLSIGLHAAARGEELPELVLAAPKKR